jgi:hypothetical protein
MARVAALWSVCRLLHQVPQTWLPARPRGIGKAGQSLAAAGSREGQRRSDSIPDWSGAPISEGSSRGFERVRSYRKEQDWCLEVAGQRVQIIKKDPEHGGVLQFGTEVVSSSDGSIAALLGASPGASTSVSIMLQLLQLCKWQRLIGREELNR